MDPQLTTRRLSMLNILDRVFDAVAVSLSPGGPRALLTWRPRSAAAFRITGAVDQSGFAPATVIDVGANVGQFSRASLGRWPAARIMAFEPLGSAAIALRRTLAALGDQHTVYQVALGSREGETVFRRHRYSHSSSVLPMTDTSRRQYSWAQEADLITVPMTRLDTVLADVPLNRPVLVKIDVQGYEAEVVSGARRVLDVADLLIMEHAFEEFYKGQSRAADVLKQLMEWGWQLDRVVDVRREGGVIVEADIVYRRLTNTEDSK